MPSEGKSSVLTRMEGLVCLLYLCFLCLLWLVCFSCTSSFLFLLFSTSTFLCAHPLLLPVPLEERSCGVAAPCSDPCSVTHGLEWKGNSQSVE